MAMNGNTIHLQNRRYIGAKYKLKDWIFSILATETKGNSFTDIFAGTGVISAEATKYYKRVIINDFLYSNFAIYQAFFANGDFNSLKIKEMIAKFNTIPEGALDENYFSKNFGGKYFSIASAKKIGFIREEIEKQRGQLTGKEYYILLASLLYAMDKIANTVGHYDAYFKKIQVNDNLIMFPIEQIPVGEVEIFREDANILAKDLKSDIVYIDPPYNSRQYSRFYHVLETLVKWDKPELFGVALKPEPENISDYCKVSAKERLLELIGSLQSSYFALSYNNTYESKSNSSRNKITLEEIKRIMESVGKTKVFEKDYRHFNSGKTDLKNHKEYLFVTRSKNA